MCDSTCVVAACHERRSIIIKGGISTMLSRNNRIIIAYEGVSCLYYEGELLTTAYAFVMGESFCKTHYGRASYVLGRVLLLWESSPIIIAY